MELRARVEQDLVTALKSGDKVRLSTLRLVKAAAEKAQVAKRGPLTDAEYQDIVTREARQRRESASLFERVGRPDAAAEARDELRVLEDYLPEQLSEDELRNAVDNAVRESGASTLVDLGKVMSRLMPVVKGKAEGNTVNRLVRDALSRSDR